MSIYNKIGVYEQVINQMPGCVGVHDLEYRIVLANDNAAKNMGFKSMRDTVGIKYSEMKCKAAEDAESFENQDKLSFTQKKKITFLSYYQYAANDWKLALGEKSPMLDSKGNVIGLMSYFTDITNYKLVDVSRFAFSSFKKFYNLAEKKFSYLIEDAASCPHSLSERQFECLFFLLRGKSAKEIASILGLSPRTVEAHLNEIKLKMTCSTKAQIIEKSFNEGLLNILPKSLFKKCY